MARGLCNGDQLSTEKTESFNPIGGMYVPLMIPVFFTIPVSTKLLDGGDKRPSEIGDRDNIPGTKTNK